MRGGNHIRSALSPEGFFSSLLEELRKRDAHVPREIANDRAADNWRIILNIADQIGAEWPAKARAAAIAIEGVESGPDADGAEGIRLLADCRTIFDVRRELKHTKEEADEISAANLIIELCALEENPWKDYGFGKPITERRFAVILRDFGIKSKKRTEVAPQFRTGR